MDLIGHRIFITGGSGGIGSATAKEAIRQGAYVAFSYHQGEQRTKELLKELKSLYRQICLQNKDMKKQESLDREQSLLSEEGGQPFAVNMDLTNKDSVLESCRMVLERFRGIDGVVHSAGVAQDQILLKMSDRDFQAPLKTNLYGCYWVSKAFLKAMLKARKGAFVHITSVSGQIGRVGQANYAASKAGIEAFSKSLAKELASRGIRSNCISPGFIDTGMTRDLKSMQDKTILTHIPMKKVGQPVQVAKPICFLLSPAADYITGQTLNVNGGMF